MDTLNFSICKSLSEIPKKDWDNLFGTGVIENYGFQKAIEESGMNCFSLGYILGKRGNHIVAIIPFFLMDFSFDVFLPRPLKSLVRFIQNGIKRFLKMRILFLGSPTAEEFYPAFSKNEDLGKLLTSAIKFLRAYCRKQKIDAFLFNNIVVQHKELLAQLEKERFIKLETVPTTRLEIKARSIDEFISKLGPSTRKDLRRKIRKTHSLTELKYELREDVSDIVDEIYKLYLNNLDDSEVQFETLTPRFFKDICANMPHVAKYFITYDRGRIACFNLIFTQGDTCIDKFIGFDYSVAHEYSLYYMTFLHNIDWCIKNGYRYYQPGTTDYHPKVRLGAELIPLYIYADSAKWYIRFTFRALGRFLEPKRLDPSLRKLEKA